MFQATIMRIPWREYGDEVDYPSISWGKQRADMIDACKADWITVLYHFAGICVAIDLHPNFVHVDYHCSDEEYCYFDISFGADFDIAMGCAQLIEKDGTPVKKGLAF
jgi:hypothetical protein